MKKNKLFMLITPMVFFATVFAVTISGNLANEKQIPIYSQNHPQEYSLLLDNEHNSLSDVFMKQYGGTDVRVNTQANGYVDLRFVSVSVEEDFWATIRSNGYLSSYSKVKGMNSMTITFADNTSSCRLNWAWESSYFGEEVTYAREEINSFSQTAQTFYFNNESPNYFRLWCGESQHCSIESIAIYYSCQEGVQPSRYQEYTISFYNIYHYQGGPEQKGSLIRSFTEYYGGYITQDLIPSNPTYSHGTFSCWYYNGEPFDFENTPVTSDMELIAHYEWYFDTRYVQYSLNPDGETYTATFTCNFVDNGFYDFDANMEVIGEDVDKNLVTKLVLSTNCKRINQLSKYTNATEIVFSSEVEYLNSRCLISLDSLAKVTFEGALPDMHYRALEFNGTPGLLNSSPRGGFRIFVNENVYNTFEHKVLMGYRLCKIGDEINLEPTITLQQYKEKSNEQSVKIADYLLSKCTNDFDRASLMLPYSCDGRTGGSIADWERIKNFTQGIVAGCSTDSEKASTIYQWLQTNIDYDAASSTYNNVVEAFDKKKGVCAQFAWLMHDMLTAVGIPSFYVNGFNYIPNNTSVIDAVNYQYNHSGSHAWILAYINGNWKFYDPTTDNGDYIPAKSSMDLDILNSYGYVAYGIDHYISCCPEEIELENISSPAIPFREEKLRSYYSFTGGMNYVNGQETNAADIYIPSYVSDNSMMINDINNSELEWGEPLSMRVTYYKGGAVNLVYFHTIANKRVDFSVAYQYLNNDTLFDTILDEFGIIVDDYKNCYYQTNNGLYLLFSLSTDEDIVIPSSVDDIDVVGVSNYAFWYIRTYKSITLCEGIREIGHGAFADASSLTDIYLPSSINVLDSKVFTGLSANIYFKGSLDDIEKSDSWNYGAEKCTFYENYDW